MKKINLFEAFAEIWSQHQALKNLWYNVNIIWISDWYIDAIVAYGITHLWLKSKKIKREEVIKELSLYSLSRDSKKPLKTFTRLSDEWISIIQQVIRLFWTLDINFLKWENFIDKDRIDLFTYSFPCQDISQQGKKCWFSKWCDSRSWLLWQVERILKEIKDINKNKLPKMLLMENVKALLNKEFKDDLNNWITTLEELWYKSTVPFIINAADLWEAQKRERVFMVSYLKWEPKEFKLNVQSNKNKLLKDIIDMNDKREELLLKEKVKIINYFWNQEWLVKKWFLDWHTSFNAENYVYHLNWVAPTITASWAQSRIKFFWKNWKIYCLTSKEHLLLQWFTKDFYLKLEKFWFKSNKIKYLAWNSINVKMLETIFKYYLK